MKLRLDEASPSGTLSTGILPVGPVWMLSERNQIHAWYDTRDPTDVSLLNEDVWRLGLPRLDLNLDIHAPPHYYAQVGSLKEEKRSISPRRSRVGSPQQRREYSIHEAIPKKRFLSTGAFEFNSRGWCLDFVLYFLILLAASSIGTFASMHIS
ncbi:hypothetical protein BCR34DRAFT_580794 [Clohesyomyces aquaticus]|uniref:Uncharacterized protein n=1 Tax=Clohesyomyces aquaticus TaxID=1231657 RepID=A0A1Y1Y4Z1_9PLEO|nr:hypothetical protein BCR34DRAFT_580794 [Clohesyomyces aquaticus]